MSLAGDSPASLALVTTSVPSTASTATIPPPATTTSSATSSGKSETITVGKEKIIQTDDPDIQVSKRNHLKSHRKAKTFLFPYFHVSFIGENTNYLM